MAAICKHHSPPSAWPSCRCFPLQASLKSDQAKLSDLQQQESQMDQLAEQTMQHVEQLAAKMDELKKQVGATVQPACLAPAGNPASADISSG